MEILIVDIETTGFLQKGGKIVEIGAASLDLETGEVKQMFDSVVHETGITLEEVENSWIVQNSDLTVEEIRHSPNLEKIREPLQNIFNAFHTGITAYNNTFDFGFLEDRGFTFKKKLDCPMRKLTPILKLPPKGKRVAGYKWPSVEEAWEFLFPFQPYKEKHRGFDDAKHEAKIVFEMYKNGWFQI